MASHLVASVVRRSGSSLTVSVLNSAAVQTRPFARGLAAEPKRGRRKSSASASASTEASGSTAKPETPANSEKVVFSARFPPPPPPPAVAFNAIYDLKRSAIRARRPPRHILEEEEDSDIVYFDPKPYTGLDFVLNRTLNIYQVAPYKFAYRNLDPRSILARTKGQDKILQVNYPEQNTVYFLGVEGAKTISDDVYSAVKKNARRHLSSVDHVFTRDAILGGVNIRLITDSPEVALALNHITIPYPPRRVDHYRPKLVVYVTPSVGNKSLGANFTVVDTQENHIYISGNTSAQSIKSALSQWVSNATSQVAVSADVLTSSTKNVLVFSNSPFPGSNLDALEGDIFATGGVLLGENSITRLFGGVVASKEATPEYGDVIENGAVVTSIRLPGYSTVSSPSSVVFYTQNAEGAPAGLSKLTKAQALKSLSQVTASGAYGQKAEEVVSRIAELLKNAEPYVFNATSSSASEFAQKIKTLL